MVLLGQDIEGHQEAIEQVAQQRTESIAPGRADIAQLVGQRVGRGLGRFAQQLEQRAGVAGKGRPLIEGGLEGRPDPGRVGCPTAQRLEVDQLAERGHRRVVGQDPEQDQLGQRALRIRWLRFLEMARELDRKCRHGRLQAVRADARRRARRPASLSASGSALAR